MGKNSTAVKGLCIALGVSSLFMGATAALADFEVNLQNHILSATNTGSVGEPISSNLDSSVRAEAHAQAGAEDLMIKPDPENEFHRRLATELARFLLARSSQ